MPVWLSHHKSPLGTVVFSYEALLNETYHEMTQRLEHTFFTPQTMMRVEFHPASNMAEHGKRRFYGMPIYSIELVQHRFDQVCGQSLLICHDWRLMKTWYAPEGRIRGSCVSLGCWVESVVLQGGNLSAERGMLGGNKDAGWKYKTANKWYAILIAIPFAY